jgi:hypothetical protein
MMLPIAPVDTLQVSQALLNLRTLYVNLSQANALEDAKLVHNAFAQLLNRLTEGTKGFTGDTVQS